MFKPRGLTPGSFIALLGISLVPNVSHLSLVLHHSQLKSQLHFQSSAWKSHTLWASLLYRALLTARLPANLGG